MNKTRQDNEVENTLSKRQVTCTYTVLHDMVQYKGPKRMKQPKIQL